MSRRTDILAAVDNLKRVHDAWESDDQSPLQPTAELERVINATIRTCESGDVPFDCRELIRAVDLMGAEWRKYEAGQRTPDYRPVPAFWEALRGVWRARAGSSRPKVRRPEPVKVLIDQKVSYQQIAQRIYGWFNPATEQFEGPLLDERGNPDIDLIHKEAEQAGSVVPKDWVHPSERERVEQEAAAVEASLEPSVRHESKPTEDPATVEELLREGAFPEQIARVKGLSINQVLSIAEQHGIEPAKMPNLAAMRAPHEPELTKEQDASLQPGWQAGADGPLEDDEDEDDDDPANSGQPGYTEEQIRELIVLMGDQFPNAGSPELVTKLRDLGAVVTVQKVSGVLRAHRLKQPATA